jgi:hypothetical protein
VKRPGLEANFHLVSKLRMHAVVKLLSHLSSLRGAELIAGDVLTVSGVYPAEVVMLPAFPSNKS